MGSEFNLSEKIFDVDLHQNAYFEEDVKEFIKKLEEHGEVLRSGVFIINYKKFKELAGKDLI